MKMIQVILPRQKMIIKSNNLITRIYGVGYGYTISNII